MPSFVRKVSYEKQLANMIELHLPDVLTNTDLYSLMRLDLRRAILTRSLTKDLQDGGRHSQNLHICEPVSS